MGSAAGLSDEKILQLEDYEHSALYDDGERAALRFADAMTASEQGVTDALFADLRRHYDDDQIVELTATVAWENASARFNRALRVPAQGLWRPEEPAPP